MSVALKDGIRAYKTKQTLLTRQAYTPDFKNLDQYDNILIFIWDNMMFGGFNHENTLKDCIYMGKGITLMPEYTMKSNGFYPYLVNDYLESHRARVHGELYAVDAHMVHRLDVLNNVTRIMDREKVYVCCRDQESVHKDKKPPIVQAYMWIHKPQWYRDNCKSQGYEVTTKYASEPHAEFGFHWKVEKGRGYHGMRN